MDTTNLPVCLAHYRAFKLLVEGRSQQPLTALVAFGLYMEAECRWAEQLSKPPADSDYVTYHTNGSMPHFLHRYQDEANGLLTQFGETLVVSHQKKVISSAVEAAVEGVHKAPKSFVRGMFEAVGGAFIWTAALIVFSIIAQRAGIDLIEVYKHASGHG